MSYGMGAIAMEPGSMYGAYGYGAGQSPYGSPGYGVYGLGDITYRPYRSWQGGYGSPGYGIYPTRPGNYLNGLGSFTMPAQIEAMSTVSKLGLGLAVGVVLGAAGGYFLGKR